MTQVPRQSLTRQLKYDGFRALAHVSAGECKLISRNGNAFRSFESLRAAIPDDLRARQAVVDGEIVCLDDQGRSQFNDVLFRRAKNDHAGVGQGWPVEGYRILP
jgi:ATP-dependent DNA ligase